METNRSAASATDALQGQRRPNATALPGRLSKDRFGYSMPVDASLYQKPPFYYRDARSLAILYETDEEAAQDLLPEGLDLPLPASARLMVLYYPFSTLGSYHEAILGLECSWRGEPRFYIAHILVTTVPPLVGGREVWGFPKKMAHIELRQEDEFIQGVVERPQGTRLATVTMRPERPLDPPPTLGGGTVSLRVIPSPEENQPPSLAQLIETPAADWRGHEMWTGSGTLSFDCPTDLDPWHKLPVRHVKGAVYTRYDFTLPHGRVLKTY
jgi:acetoacetate decarboxylase